MHTEITDITVALQQSCHGPSRAGELLYRFRRHPFEVTAWFQHCLVLTYALPAAMLDPLLPPGLLLDTFHGFGFLAIAMVQTRALRPTFLPSWLGRDFFLSGYRIFARYKTENGRTLRGLRILRSDTNRRAMKLFGNWLTHYNYHLAEVNLKTCAECMEIQIRTPQAEANLHVIADLKAPVTAPPPGSPFADLREARGFAGPLPFTFDYEQETDSLVLIEGVRRSWQPKPVQVEVLENTFLRHRPFSVAQPVLANAFYVENIPYSWRRGVVEKLL